MNARKANRPATALPHGATPLISNFNPKNTTCPPRLPPAKASTWRSSTTTTRSIGAHPLRRTSNGTSRSRRQRFTRWCLRLRLGGTSNELLEQPAPSVSLFHPLLCPRSNETCINSANTTPSPQITGRLYTHHRTRICKAARGCQPRHRRRRTFQAPAECAQGETWRCPLCMRQPHMGDRLFPGWLQLLYVHHR